MPCSETESPWRKSRSTSTVGKEGKEMWFKKRKREAYFPYQRKKLYIKSLNIWVDYLWKSSH